MNITRNTRYEDLPYMLKLEEMIAFLGISKPTAYRMMQSDELKPYIKKYTGYYLINKEFLLPKATEQLDIKPLQNFK